MFVAALLAATALQSAPALHSYGGLTLDPAGRAIATVEGSAIVVRGTDGAVQRTIDPCDPCSYGGPAWSPDGSALAFIADAGDDATLYVARGGEASAVATVHGLASTPEWSADGSTLAMLVVENPSKEIGATSAGARQVGEMAELSLDSQRIATVPATGGDLSFASPDGTFVYEYDWTPDGAGFVATAAEGNGDNNWWVASLRRFGRDGSTAEILKPAYQMNYPRVSPDGRTVAFIGGVMSDFGSIGGDVYTVPMSGGAETNVTPGATVTFTSIAWRGDRLMAGVISGGDTGLAVLNPADKAIERTSVTAGATLSSGDGRASFDRTGRRVAFVSETWERAPRIEFGSIGETRAITDDNAGLQPNVRSRSLTWESDGRQVQGWLLEPLNLTGDGKHPMIVNIHGGPSAAFTPRYVSGGTVRDLLDAGYFVFQPNPRGSYGQGAAFEKANYQDFGGGDLKDILTGVDAVEAVAPVDDDRLGVYGHSYGGFMTMWTVTHSQRFHAAVAGAGIANWGSYYGQNGIDQWMTPFFGARFYDDPSVYDRLSPIRTINNAKTPTFLYVGERDLETPAPQSMEFWHALVANKVPTSLVIYQDEGHSIRQPEHTADLTRRIVGWFDRYLK